MAFKTFTAGSVLTASDVNTYLMKQSIIQCTSGTRPTSPSDGWMIYETDTKQFRYYSSTLTKWRNIVSAGPSVFLAKTSSPSISNNSITTVNWDSAIQNDFGMWSGASANLVTVQTDGIYNVILSVRWQSQTTVVGYRQCRIDVGGAEQNVFNLAPTTALNSTNPVTHLTHPMELNSGDQIEAKVFQNSGGALTLHAATRLFVYLVSET